VSLCAGRGSGAPPCADNPLNTPTLREHVRQCRDGKQDLYVDLLVAIYDSLDSVGRSQRPNFGLGSAAALPANVGESSL